MATKNLSKKTAAFNDMLDNLPPAYVKSLRVNEYMLVLDLPEPLRDKITKVKQHFYESYQAPTARGGRPNIGLVKFFTWDMMEEKVINRLDLITMATKPFKVELQDYGSIPSHTICINISTTVKITELVKELKTAQRLMRADPQREPHFMNEQNIPVARKLLPWQFEKGWLEFSHRQFSGRFIADAMLLLKRREGEKAYQIVKRFEFQNLPVATKQGALFF